jgi:ATP adenylyltransferase
MKRLWAPWRIEFILKPKSRRCVLCLKPRENRDRDNCILYRGRYCFVMMNIYPYNNGHLLVSPYRHIGSLDALEDNVLCDMVRILKKSAKAVKLALSPQGINIGLNLGKVAGAGIDDHIHFHIVPRWQGDTSFMAVMDDIRVLPEHLRVTYDKLLSYFAKRNPIRKAQRKRRKK